MVRWVIDMQSAGTRPVQLDFDDLGLRRNRFEFVDRRYNLDDAGPTTLVVDYAAATLGGATLLPAGIAQEEQFFLKSFDLTSMLHRWKNQRQAG